MTRYGCRYGLPHDLARIHETPHAIWEVCRICNRKFRWNKGYRRRIDNVKYLEAHARNYAQRFGRTKRLYYKIYDPKKLTISI